MTIFSTSSPLPLQTFPPSPPPPPVLSPSYPPPPPSSSSSSSSSSCLSDHTLNLAVPDSPPLPPPTFNRDYFNSLPPGYRFSPTDEELVTYYLAPYLASRTLPPNRILTVDIYSHHPAILAEEYKDCGENGLYFFTSREKKYPRGNKPRRSTDTGYWKATGSQSPVICARRGTTIATRRSLVFFQGQHAVGKKTDWLMHEFTLKTNTKFDAYVLCKIYRKTSSAKKDAGSSTPQNSEETNQVMEIDQTGSSVANTGHGPEHVEQHQQQQQTGSHQSLPQGHQLMDSNNTNGMITTNPTYVSAQVAQYQAQQQYEQQTSSHHSLPQSHQLMGSNNTLNPEQNGMISTNTGYVSTQVEQQQHQQETISHHHSTGMIDQQNGMITTNTTSYVSSQVEQYQQQYQQQTSSQYSLPLLDQNTLNAEQNGMITTNTGYGYVPSEIHQGMDMRQNGQSQQADLLSLLNDQCSFSLPPLVDFDPNCFLDLSNDDDQPSYLP